jgi:thymidylate synthase ThyX
MRQTFSEEERRALQPYFTNIDGPVFALRNLPEVVKGAMFARYSRSPKSLRRLFLDEFLDKVEAPGHVGEVGVERADRLYERVFNEYGDDSVAQLGGAHLACEGASHLLTKVLEWGRLMAYLEQSTRYIAYTDRVDDRWKYLIPAELDGSPLRDRYVSCLDAAFATYTRLLQPMDRYFEARYPKVAEDAEAVYRRTIRAKSLDVLRGLLPAATQSNVGLFGSGQAYEALLLRMRVHPLAEVREYAQMMLVELRKVIPSFLRRVDQANRGEQWSRYLQATSAATAGLAERLVGENAGEARPEVALTDYDADGELKVVAAALYSACHLPDDQLIDLARNMSGEQRREVLAAYVGERGNRRHKPGRAFERTGYRFDVLTDYGAFRDLQRHRLLTLEWQRLVPNHGYAVPEAIEAVGATDEWRTCMQESAELYEAMSATGMQDAASYAVAMAYRVRFYMHMNAREAMHVIELRTSPQGHASYRRVCQTMHRLIADQAGHRAIAATMTFVDHSQVELERLEAERASERRRRQGAAAS